MNRPTHGESAWIIEPGHVKITKDEIPCLLPNEVLVKVKNMGICGTDLEIYQGNMLYYAEGIATYPIIPGHEWSGQVWEIGSSVRGLKVGDRVVGETTLPCNNCNMCKKGKYNLCPGRKENGILGKNGAAAQYMIYPSNGLHTFDSSIDFESACLTEPAAVAYRGIEKVNVSPSDRVVVFGAGTLGLLSLQAAEVFGAKQIVLIDINEFRLKLGKDLGADHVIDISQESLIETCNLLTGNHGFDVVIEASGSLAAIESILSVTTAGSRICLMGLCGGHRAQINTDRIVTSDLHICGSLGSPGVWTTVLELMRVGKILTKPMITHRYSLGELSKALGLLKDREPELLKAMIQFD